MTRRLLVTVASLVLTATPYAARPSTQTGVIAGVVKKADGAPAVGAYVKVRNAERKLTFMVISQAQGRFRAEQLPRGRYEAQAIGGGMQTDPVVSLELTDGQQATADLVLNAPQTAAPKELTHRDYGNLAAWSSHLPRTWLQGAAAKYRVVEYALAINTDPHDVAADSTGVAWVSERRTGKIGRFDPRDLSYTTIDVPAGKSGRYWLSAIEVDPQDRVWTIDGVNGRLVRYDPKNKQFTFFVIPEPPSGRGVHFNTIRFHPDGSVWGTQSRGDQIVRLDPATEKVTTFDLPEGKERHNGAHPYGMAIDGNQKIWVAENGAWKVAKLDPQTGRITEFTLAGDDARPRRMTADADGDVWVCMGEGDWAQGGKLARIDHRTSAITYFDPPSANAGPSSPGADLRRRVIWFMETQPDLLARFDPRTKTFAEFALPTWRSLVRRIEVDRSGPNRIWFSGSGIREDDSNLGYDKIGFVEILD